MHPFNLCSSVLTLLPLETVIDVAIQTGFKGIELRVHPVGHQSIDELEQHGKLLNKTFDRADLAVPVLNSYIAVEDFTTVDRLIGCAHSLGAQKIRLVLPRAEGSSAYSQAVPSTVIPSYELNLHPTKALSHLRAVLRKLEAIAYRASITFLLELHWGTIMSSFSAAYWLLRDFDPKCLAVTFDPANMVIEGKEDWDYGISLLSPYIQNVHVKNVVWNTQSNQASWTWSPIQVGVLDWAEIINILIKNDYNGDYAIEDFLLDTKNKDQAKHQLQKSFNHLTRCYEDCRSRTPQDTTKASIHYSQVLV